MFGVLDLAQYTLCVRVCVCVCVRVCVHAFMYVCILCIYECKWLRAVTCMVSGEGRRWCNVLLLSPLLHDSIVACHYEYLRLGRKLHTDMHQVT